MSSNLLCLNPSKTEFIIIRPAQIKKIPDPSIHLSNDSSSTTFPLDALVRNLGVTCDPHLSFSSHISEISRSCFIHFHDLRRIRSMLNFKTASTIDTSIDTSIVHSKLDFFSISTPPKYSVCDLSKTQLHRLLPERPGIIKFTHVLKTQHWLKIAALIHFKVLYLTYNSLQSSQPTYLCELFTIHAANPFYPIILLSHPFSTPGHSSSHVLQPSHIHHCTASLE